MAMIGHSRQKFVTYPISTNTPDADTSLINWIAEIKFDADYQWRREDWNRAYYGEDVRTVDILVGERVSNPAANPLRDTIATIHTPAE